MIKLARCYGVGLDVLVQGLGNRAQLLGDGHKSNIAHNYSIYLVPQTHPREN